MSFCYVITNLHSQMGNNGSLVSLKSLQGNLSNLALGLAHEHLTSCSQHLLILTLDLNLEMEARRKCHVLKEKQRQQAKDSVAVSAS